MRYSLAFLVQAVMAKWQLNLGLLFPLLGSVRAAYSTWHTIDDEQVICPVLPKPAVYPATAFWPTEQMYEVKIDIAATSGMNIDKPHIVSFIRDVSKAKAVAITYEVTDADGVPIVPLDTVMLESTDIVTRERNGGVDGCTCTGDNGNIANNPRAYPEDYGKTCGYWDSDVQNECIPWYTSAWDKCCRAWCYVESTCPDALMAEVNYGAFYSYSAACGSTPAPNCVEPTPPASADPCACIDPSSAANAAKYDWKAADTTKWGVGYGATCSQWDKENCANGNYYVGQIDTWCCESWCYVSNTCPDVFPSLLKTGLYWAKASSNRLKTSTGTMCSTPVMEMAQCPFKASPVQASPDQTYCTCMGYAPPGLSSTYPSDYGATCKAHDKTNCRAHMGASATLGIYCCQSWCYVDEECPTANPSALVANFFWSYTACPDVGANLRTCTQDPNNLCQPTGVNTGVAAAKTWNPALGAAATTYGTSCAAHDEVNCAAWWSADTTIWNSTDPVKNSWCCQSWAYVEEACPGAEEGMANLAYSYKVCDDLPNSAANTRVWNGASCQASCGSYSCTPGHYRINLQSTTLTQANCCAAWGCTTSATGCLTCVAQASRTSATHCASCNAGYNLVSGMCQAEPEPSSGGRLLSEEEQEQQERKDKIGNFQRSLQEHEDNHDDEEEEDAKTSEDDDDDEDAEDREEDHDDEEEEDAKTSEDDDDDEDVEDREEDHDDEEEEDAKTSEDDDDDEDVEDHGADIDDEEEKDAKTSEDDDAEEDGDHDDDDKEEGKVTKVEECWDTDNELTDVLGEDCDAYTKNPNACGTGFYDTHEFRSDKLCCACGGGSLQEVEVAAGRFLRGSRRRSSGSRRSPARRRSPSPPVSRRRSPSRVSAAGRRRAPAGGTSVGTTSTRRRTGASSARRRAAAATPRRRAAPSTPRRRAPVAVGTAGAGRRRTGAPSPPSPSSPRRRAPLAASNSNTGRRRVNPAAERRRRSATYTDTRRRAQSVGGRVYTSERRRAPSADTGRRRGSGTTDYAHRRRRTPPASTPTPPPPPPEERRRRSTPRRRGTPRRRRTAVPPAPAAPRRRAPPPAPPPYVEDAHRRRRTTVEHRRRRSPVNYGYTQTNQLTNNYGGTAPVKSSYGFSGQAQKTSTVTKVMMAGAAVAGASVLAFGGYYAYQRYSEGKQTASAAGVDVEWCRVPDTSTQSRGKMIQCSDCATAYGAGVCKNEDSCYSGGGCNYVLPSDTFRDDLMATGFVPNTYKSPITIKITRILGEDFTTALICPKNNDVTTNTETFVANSVVNPDLYVTLAEQGVLEIEPTCDSDARSPCDTDANCEQFATCVNGYCKCSSGHCYDSVTFACVKGKSATTSDASYPFANTWILVLALFASMRAIRRWI